MKKYCKTMTEIDGQRWYGIDLVSAVDLTVLLSAEAVTTDFDRAYRIVRWLNWVGLEPALFESFVAAVRD